MDEGQRVAIGAPYFEDLECGQVDEQDRLPARRAPALGEHTDEILAEVLSLSDSEIGRLHDAGVVAGPTGVAV